MGDIDRIKIDELRIHIDNTDPLYNQYISFAKNYAKKKDRGVYDRDLAIKGLSNNLVANGIRSYNKDFGGMSLSKDEKEILAKELLVTLERDEIPRFRKSNNSNNRVREGVLGRGTSRVKSHSRKGTKGVKSHTRNVKRRYK